MLLLQKKLYCAFSSGRCQPLNSQLYVSVYGLRCDQECLQIHFRQLHPRKAHCDCQQKPLPGTDDGAFTLTRYLPRLFKRSAVTPVSNNERSTACTPKCQKTAWVRSFRFRAHQTRLRQSPDGTAKLSGHIRTAQLHKGWTYHLQVMNISQAMWHFACHLTLQETALSNSRTWGICPASCIKSSVQRRRGAWTTV